jgi:hypothetical protein
VAQGGWALTTSGDRKLEPDAPAHVTCIVRVDATAPPSDPATGLRDFNERVAPTGHPPTGMSETGAACALKFKGSFEELSQLTAAVEAGTVIDLGGAVITSQVRSWKVHCLLDAAPLLALPLAPLPSTMWHACRCHLCTPCEPQLSV